MRTALRLLGTGLFVGAVLAACGGDSDSDIGGGSVAIDDVPKLYAGSACKAAQKCFGGLYEVFTGGEDCAKTYEAALSDELPRLKAGIESGTITYDGTKLQACLDAVESLGCNLDGDPPECTAAMDGTVEVGGDCQMNAECKGADTLCKVEAACPGKCAKKGLAGTDCERDSDCTAALACSKDTNKCVVPATEGQPCEGGGTAPECQPGLFCLGSDDDGKKPGSCKTLADGFSGKSGDACWFGGKPACTTDLRCVVESANFQTGVIVTKCGAGFASGAACKVAIPDGCPIGEYCKVPAKSIDGTCTLRPKAGEPCGKLFDDDVCAADTRCEGGQCRPRQKLGGQCGSDEICYSDNCVSGGCAPSGGCQ